MNRQRWTALTCILLVLAWFCPARAGNVEKEIETPVHQAVDLEKDTQAQQAQWRDEREKKTTQFDALEKEVDLLKKELATETTRNTVLKEKVASKQKQLADISEIEGQITPFLGGLLNRLKSLKDNDLPFLKAERDQRISTLSTLNADPDAPVSEKFRKLMEALLVETEYGQTVEVYQETIPIEGDETLVNIFRLGRLRLFYQTLDKQHCGFYNTAQKTWDPLDHSYLKPLQAAVDMGSKRKPVEILDLPIGRLVIQ